MISIIVQRSPADRTGDDIVDPLLASDSAALERGRNAIDATCSNRSVATATGPHRHWVQPGSLIEYHGTNGTWRGLLTRCAITITRDGDSFTADRAFELEKEA